MEPLATCVIGSIAKVLATSIGEAGAHDRPSDATSSLERLLQHVIESLSMAAADTSVSVRCYARAGLASIPRPGMHAQKNSYVMSLLSSCCDDESNDGIVAGLGGIGTIFSSLETQADDAGKAEAVDDSFSSLSPLQTAMRVRSCCFGSSNGRVREAALAEGVPHAEARRAGGDARGPGQSCAPLPHASAPLFMLSCCECRDMLR